VARPSVADPGLFSKFVSITKSFFIELAFLAKALEEEEERLLESRPLLECSGWCR
jgi:hypothetical protein